MIIENSKTYKGKELEDIFFIPTFTGKAADELGVRVLYNMPVPTNVTFWNHNVNLLQKFSSGWNGSNVSNREQMTIDLQKVKAENCFSADDYSSLVYEHILASSDVNFGDLTGTELEKIETELFRYAIVKGVYATMWLGDMSGEKSNFDTFDGFLKHIETIADSGDTNLASYLFEDEVKTGKDVMDACWDGASGELKSLRSDGKLVYYVSSDIYNKYLAYLDEKGGDLAYNFTSDGASALTYHGIPVIEVSLSFQQYSYPKTFCVLTDRRNMVLALNTADTPENEVRMWYNPEEMENRQRAVFLAGTAILNPDMVSWAYKQ